MYGDTPIANGQQSASSSILTELDQNEVDDLDGANEGDLSLDTALLAEDPLDDSNGKAP